MRIKLIGFNKRLIIKGPEARHIIDVKLNRIILK